MNAQADLGAARTAVRDLLRSVDELRRHYADSVDLRRLAIDAERVREDLDLLAGPEAGSAGAPSPLMVIEDRDYPADFWGDAGDEGLGRHSGSGRSR